MKLHKVILTVVIIIATLIIIIFFLFKYFNSACEKKISSKYILGIDVSHHQGNINWKKVYDTGRKFAWVKATEGLTHIDSKFYRNMKEGKKAGVVIGAYHFARPCKNTSAIQEANQFVAVARSYIGTGFLPPALDLENFKYYKSGDLKKCRKGYYTKSKLTQWVQEWINTVEKETGVTPVIYTTTGYAKYLKNSLNSYGLWIAKPYSSPGTAPRNIGIWNNSWAIKQYSWRGKVCGIRGRTDLNRFNGTMVDFNNFIGKDVRPSK